MSHEELERFTAQYAGDATGREIILFLGQHPFARFSQLALRSALRSNVEIAGSLRQLVSRGVIKSADGNGIRLYWLTNEEPVRGLVLGISGMDFIKKRRLLFGKPEAATETALAYCTAD